MHTDLFLKFSRQQWAALRGGMPLSLSAQDLIALRGVCDEISLDEVVDVYLPLARLLNIHIAASHSRARIVDEFLEQPVTSSTYIIAVTGSVAVGKSTFSRVLREMISRWPSRPKVQLVTTDGFLYPNQTLEERGLMMRKGFPESYDLRCMISFLAGLKSGKEHLQVPVYSHHTYDILPGQNQEIREPDIVILEGLNILQVNTTGEERSANVFVSDMVDFSIYVDAEEEDIKRWYIERFLTFKRTAFQKPTSYFHRFSDMDEPLARQYAEQVWAQINQVNLRENIRPTRERAHVVLRKGPDHLVDEVWLRRV
jgi:type I pantothenate kinase